MIATAIAAKTILQGSTALINELSSVALPVGWALLHFLWQGTALAAVAAFAMSLCRRSSARYMVGVGALMLMLLAPVVTIVYLHDSGVADTGKSSPLAAVAWSNARGRAAASGAAHEASVQDLSFGSSWDALPWVVEAWLLGVAFFSLRSVGGFFLIERERRRQSRVVGPRVLEICRTLQSRLGLSRTIAYCESLSLQAPAVIGWFRPVVFLPVTALTGLSEEQLEVVIAHELAHVRRFDPFVNVFQICVEAVLYFHPAVWWLNKRIRAEREHCCDDIAVALCGNAVEYARALTLMEEWRSAPVFAMAANRGPLAERVLRVLGLKTLGAGMRSIGLTGSALCLAAALIAGNALLGMAQPQSAAAGFLMQAISQTNGVQSSPSAAAGPRSVATPKPSAGQGTSTAPSGAAASYIDQMKSAGLGEVTVDDLIALKSQNVTPEYIRAMHELGLHPDADGFVGMKVQGITPEYVKEMRAIGFNPDVDQLIGLKVQGVTAEYVKGMKEVGIKGDADDMIGMKVQGVTPEYVREMKEVGIELDSDSIIGMKVQGVTPEYVKEMRAQGMKVDADDVVGMKVQGVTPAYVQELKQQGLNPSSDDVVGMKVQGVTPEYIHSIRALGFSPSADELVGMKVQGVTAEYIKALQAAGFKPSIDDVIGAKVQGVTAEFIERVKQHGFKDLTLEKIVQLKVMGILDSKAEM